ncbi:MAG: Murein DD-endopeptidase MepM [Chloroflexi bacterium]|nr:MAG: Murein DD-endopeptidase MepM [Chloroflexota bacterium]
MRPLFDVQSQRRSRLRLLFAFGLLLTVGLAVGAALLFHEDAVAPAATQTPSAVAAATPAGQDDVVTPPSTDQAAGEQAADAPAGVSAAADPDVAAGADPDPPATAADADSSSDDATATSPAGADSGESADPPVTVEAEEPPSPVPPSVIVTPATVAQGQSTLVILAGDIDADRVFVSIDGYTGEMVREDAVGWVGFVPITPVAAARRYNVVIDTFSAEVYQTTFLGELLVQETLGEIEQITLDPATAALLAPELVAIDNTTRFQQYTDASGPRLWTGPWRLPVFGVHEGAHGVLRSYNGGPASDWHHGHDISADAGSLIVAPARGRVVFATELPVHGLGVILDHGAGVFSGYWHMSEIQAQVGDLLNPGDPLGLVGTTGVSTGPHLHWEVIVQGVDVDPIQWTETALFATGA